MDERPVAEVASVAEFMTITALSPIRTVDDLLGLVPHLIGFHPDDSLVLLLLVDRRLELTARCDLADLDTTEAVRDLIGAVLGRYPEAGVWLLAYSPSAEVAWPVLEAAAAQLGDSCLGRLHVDGTRWWSSVTDPGVAYRSCTSAAAAEATAAGLLARPSRGDLASLLVGDPMPAKDFVRHMREAELPTDRAERAELGAAIVSRLVVSRQVPSDAECAVLSVVVADPAALHAAIVATTSADAERLQQIWLRVSRRAPRSSRAAPVGLLGLSALAAGEGALVNLCADLVDQLQPGHVLGRLLAEANRRLVSPADWECLRFEFADEGLPSSDEGADHGADRVGESHGQAADHDVAEHRRKG